jgi:hypothetical protein
MSTPVVAANAALIRQYFEDEDFWKKYCNKKYELCSSGSFSPSGSLLKALILQSGIGLKTYTGIKLK